MKAKNAKIYKPKEFAKLLNSLGFYYDRTRGSHDIYVNDKREFVSIPMNGKKEINPMMTKLALQRIERGLCDKC